MKKLIFTLAASALLALACQKFPDGRETLIAFNVSDVKVETGVTTRVSETVASTLNSNGIYVNCTQGSAGSETSVWSNVHFTYSGGTFSGNKWWPASNPSYHFYASSSAIAHTAAGATVAATNDADVVCAYSPNPTFAVTNTLVFNHIFARLGSVTFTASSGYTITGITATITPKTGGTYNLRTEAWSSVTTGSATSIANSTPGTKSNDIYLVPGTYTVTASWTATKGGYTKTFTDRTYDVELVAGYVNTLTASFGGNATDIQFTVGIEAWKNNALALGAYPHENPPAPVNALMFTNTGSANSVTVTLSNNGGNTPSVEYSIDGESWSSWDYSAITLTPGESVYIRGNNPDGFSSSSSKFSKFSFSGSSTVSCEGNVMTLLDYTTPPTTIPSAYCYYKMFQGCTSLTTAPELSATTLSYGCYNNMFSGCTSLTTAPELPATTLAVSCYSYMFYGCSSLNYVKAMFTTTPSSTYTNSWLKNVATSGTFVKNSAATWSVSGANGIPSGWTVQTTSE